MTQRPFRFGVQAVGPAERAGWLAKAREVEQLGFATFLMPDHFGDQLAPVPALAAAAEATTTLRVGAFVFDNDFKHPVVLAKEVATLDVLSGGRVECGMGAGWLRSEYAAAGIPFDAASVRIDRLEEALRVLKGLWDDGEFSFTGNHYTIDALDGRPRPLQRPHPPLLVGGGGRRMLALAAREADIVGFNPQTTPAGALDWATTSLAAVEERVGWVRAAAGDRIDQLELNLTVTVPSTPDLAAGAEEIAARWGVDPAHVRDSPFALLGDSERMADTLLARRERLGISYLTVGERGMARLAPVVARLAGT